MWMYKIFWVQGLLLFLWDCLLSIGCFCSNEYLNRHLFFHFPLQLTDSRGIKIFCKDILSPHNLWTWTLSAFVCSDNFLAGYGQPSEATADSACRSAEEIKVHFGAFFLLQLTVFFFFLLVRCFIFISFSESWDHILFLVTVSVD